MSRTPEEIKEMYKEYIEAIKYRWQEKREELELAELIDIYLSLLANNKGLDVWFTVKMHNMSLDGDVKTVVLIGDDEE